MNTPRTAHPNPLGHEIAGHQVRGEERDARNRWVGADVVIRVRGVGEFFLNLLTREHFADEVMATALDAAENATPAMLSAVEHRPPFVVNDQELSSAVLDRVLDGLVGPDLAPSLWYSGPTATD